MTGPPLHCDTNKRWRTDQSRNDSELELIRAWQDANKNVRNHQN
jgi:hypothetical protein